MADTMQGLDECAEKDTWEGGEGQEEEEEGWENEEVYEEAYDESSDDELQPKALPITGPPSFAEGPPTSAEEYLRQVRWEAKQLPQVVCAKLDLHRFEDNRTKYIPRMGQLKAEEELSITPASHRPEPMWMEAFLSDFKEIRAALAASKWRECKNFDQSKVPQSRDGQAWERFCFGRKGDDDSSASLGEEGETQTERQTESGATGNPPLLSVLATLDERRTAGMLRQMVKWVECAPSLDEPHAQWLFALLCALSTPMDANTAASLRALVRWCYKRRALVTEADSEVERCNIVLMIAGRFFSQGGDIEI
jgi:survival of motor neuron protein-interacting protein 1